MRSSRGLIGPRHLSQPQTPTVSKPRLRQSIGPVIKVDYKVQVRTSSKCLGHCPTSETQSRPAQTPTIGANDSRSLHNGQMPARRRALGTVRKLRSSQEKWDPRKGPPWGSRLPGRSAVCLCIVLPSTHPPTSQHSPLPSPPHSPALPLSLHSRSSAGRGLFSAPAAMETQATDPRLSSCRLQAAQ